MESISFCLIEISHSFCSEYEMCPRHPCSQQAEPLSVKLDAVASAAPRGSWAGLWPWGLLHAGTMGEMVVWRQRGWGRKGLLAPGSAPDTAELSEQLFWDFGHSLLALTLSSTYVNSRTRWRFHRNFRFYSG